MRPYSGLWGETVYLYGHASPSPPLIPLYVPGEHVSSLPYPAPYGWDASSAATALMGPGELIDVERGFCWMTFKGLLLRRQYAVGGALVVQST